MFNIFVFDYLVGVAGEVAEQGIFCDIGVHADPVFGRQVERLADIVVTCLQFAILSGWHLSVTMP